MITKHKWYVEKYRKKPKIGFFDKGKQKMFEYKISCYRCGKTFFIDEDIYLK